MTPTNCHQADAVRPSTTTTTPTLAKADAGVTDLVALGVGLLDADGLLLLGAFRWVPPGRRRPGAGPAGDDWTPAT